MRQLTKASAAATFLLILVGSLVTSTGSGLAVPDWPLAYGRLFPPMVGGILYEHGHRMFAAAVGLLVVVQAAVLTVREQRLWVRVLAWVAVAAIVLQGVLGGLTVLFFLPTPVSVAHALLAQSLLVLLVVIAYAESREWRRRQQLPRGGAAAQPVWPLVMWLPAVVFAQLLLGALMRHTDAGLAILDFPLSAGRVIPSFDTAMLNTINAGRFALLLEPVTSAQVHIHFLHRVGAVVVLATVATVWVLLRRRAARWEVGRLVSTIVALMAVQIALGAATVLSVRLPLVASAHVLLGAGLLALSALCLLRAVPLPTARRSPSAAAESAAASLRVVAP